MNAKKVKPKIFIYLIINTKINNENNEIIENYTRSIG